jgi:hypothetical protein
MQSTPDPYDRRRNRGFGGSQDDLDLDQRNLQRRQGQRIALRLWTEGRCEGQLDFHNCSNLSENGIFIENPDPYEVDALVDLEFNLPGVHDPIRATCRVVSSLDDKSAGEAIMGNGFIFERIHDADRALLRAWVEVNAS